MFNIIMYMAIIYYIIDRDWAYNSNYTFNVLAQKLSKILPIN